ncbi:MAG: tetratricopeptide repeat protein [Chloroflexi bacterium]|nr:tetratricopeptide repeat protein [Chloroflexota bacterium]
MDDKATVTRAELAHRLLVSTSVGALRRGLRHHKSWSKIYRGFRPEGLTHTSFVNHASAFALDPDRLNELVELFLDDLGVANGPRESRLHAAIDDSRIDDDTRKAIAVLVEADSLSVIPAGVGKALPYPTTATVDTKSSKTVALPPEPESETKSGLDASPPLPEEATAVPVARATPQPVTQAPLPFEFFDWDSPDDDVSEVQQAVTLFERSLVALVRDRLTSYHGEQWLERGCGKGLLNTLKGRADNRETASPETLLGYAHIGELLQVIVASRSWPAFSAIFEEKQFLEKQFSHVIGIRTPGMHAGDRSLFLTEQVAGLAAMVRIAACYHPATASAIDTIYTETITNASEREDAETVFGRTMTNLAELTNPMVIGREAELRDLHAFWTDEFSRVVSIVGPGGVGKTALLEEFLYEILSAPCKHTEDPNPEIVVFLTAKDNWQSGMEQAPPSLRFSTLGRVQEVTLSFLDVMPQGEEPEEIRDRLLSMCQNEPILFALDNLESLDDIELEAIGTFLDELPRPSKALVTTRDSRRIGRKLELRGLPEGDSIELLRKRLEVQGLELPSGDEATLSAIARATGGVPLLLIYCANVIALGCTPSEALDRLRGDEFLRFLDFAFDSSVLALSDPALALAYFLSLKRSPTRRQEMLFLFPSETDLDDAIQRLGQLSFVERTQNGKRVLFRLSTPQLREYLLKRAPEGLASETVSRVRQEARVGPAESESENVAIAIEQVIREAQGTARDLGWSAGIEELQRGRERWGDDRRILAALGYLHFRDHNRAEARRLLERSIAAGHESAETYTDLALVYYFDRQYDRAVARAETALSLRPNHDRAHQVLSESLLGKAMTGRLMITESQRRDLLRRALQHARESIIDDDMSAWSQAHNERSRDIASRVDRVLAEYEPADGSSPSTRTVPVT